MSNNTKRILPRLPVVGGLAALAFLLFVPDTAQAQGAVLFACYVPNSGVIYRVNPPGSPGQTADLKDDCTGKKHVKFSWDGADNDWTISGNNMFSAVSGNVGIGTTNPEALLHISGNGTVANIKLTDTDAGGHDWSLLNDNNADFAIIEGTPVTTFNARLYIQAGGNVGIGTPNPPQNWSANPPAEQLHVLGKALADAHVTPSSRRWKENISTIEGALEKVQRLRGVAFNWTADGRHDIGLIAEEVGEVLPEVVTFEDNGEDARSMNYGRLVALLIEAIKEQQAQIGELTAAVRSLSGTQ